MGPFKLAGHIIAIGFLVWGLSSVVANGTPQLETLHQLSRAARWIPDRERTHTQIQVQVLAVCFDRKIHDLTLCSLNPFRRLVQPSRFDDGSRISPFATRVLLFPTVLMEGLIQDRRVKRSAVRKFGFH